MQATGDIYSMKANSGVVIRYGGTGDYANATVSHDTAFQMRSILGIQKERGCELNYNGGVSIQPQILTKPFYHDYQTASAKLANLANS